MSREGKRTIVIAAGGTGGHIFPAIATGEKLKELNPEVEIHYACGERPLEIGLYERSGIKPVVFPSRQLKPGVAGKMMGVGAAFANLFRAYRWIKKIKADVVVGFGGYVAGPTMLAGKIAGCKTAIHEANSVPGKTNQILGRFMDLSATHFGATLQALGGRRKVALGMPLRKFQMPASVESARRQFDLDGSCTTLLIVGGSQGAKYLYETIIRLLPELDDRVTEPLQVLWSTGEGNFQTLKEQVETLSLRNITVRLVPFISDMAAAITAADVAIARAGASALAELVSLGTYSIFVPFPGAIYDHQTLNAREAQNWGAGVVIAEGDISKQLIPAILQAVDKVRSGYRVQVSETQNSTLASGRLAEEILNL